MYAPKQRGKLKEQLRYIGRYIRRPAIGMNRIEEYDGQFVTFKYIDKKDGKEKHEVVTVEEFISRLIRYIPSPCQNAISPETVSSQTIKVR
ncbi:transposase [Heyndrickxia coagulans]|nr:transposase [Heyndrickxia coagulans]UZH05453.1 transposase [Heyndrickxia coagulans]